MWELVSFVQGRIRRLCLEALASGPKMPGAIARSSGSHTSHVSRALRELAEKGLVECVTPDATKNRIYRTTDKGTEVLKKLKEMG